MKYPIYKLSLLLLVLVISPSFAQNLKFSSFGAEKGLPDNYVNSIIQDNKGFIWIATGQGISRFDGFSFVNSFPGDTIRSGVVDKSYKDSQGRMWFGFRDGTIAVYDGKMKLLRPDSIHSGNIIGFTETSSGEILAGTQNKGIISVGKDHKLEYLTVDEGQNLTTLAIAGNGDLLAGTFEGLQVYRMDKSTGSFSLAGHFEDIPSSRILTISQRKGTSQYWVGTEDEGLYLVTFTDEKNMTAIKTGEDQGIGYSRVVRAIEDNEKNLWVATNGDGLFKLMPGSDQGYNRVVRYSDVNGLPSNYLNDMYMDIEGNFWFASVGLGVTVLKDQAFTFFSFENALFNDNILSLSQDGVNYYLGSEGSLLITTLSSDRKEILLTARNGLPGDKITALYDDGGGNIWIGTSGSGVYRMRKGTDRADLVIHSHNSLENIINAITGDNDHLWIATYGGLMIIDRNTLTKRILTTRDRLPHNKIRYVFRDSKNKIWIATRAKGIYNITDELELTIDAKNELEFSSIAEDKDGNLWAATDGEGVFGFTRDSLTHYSTQNGLRSNYCYSIGCDKNGRIWVGHRLGLSRIDNQKKNVISYSTEQGMSADCNQNAIIQNDEENLVFGTSKGLIEYDPDRDNLIASPPLLNITSLRISDQEYDFTRDVHLPYNVYRIRIDYVGINMKNPEGVRYQYRLEGFDNQWSELSALRFTTFRLSEGKYRFHLRAYDAQGNYSEASLLDITIRLPFWKTWWFILLAIVTMTGSLYAFIKIRERNQKQLQEYLEKELDARTKEVKEQAEVIESKNRDITDSINYAQRIQASVLPSVHRLKNTFPGSFVFYQPRDIVSGDFYWYDKISDSRFIIVCADSTGHGVPGAFMSMIGTTLIKDICSRKGVKTPSEILMILDREIKDALNQNAEAEKSNDGMDIIVAEFDLRKKYLRVASAMRPIILYIDGQQIYVKGSRSSVGGKYEASSEKEFTTEEFQLSSGDLVYMFSDGYPDQFGGPLGKKFKMARLKNLIRDIHDKSMDEQYNYIKNNFNLWKEDLEQVDDVLFMGIKV